MSVIITELPEFNDLVDSLIAKSKSEPITLSDVSDAVERLAEAADLDESPDSTPVFEALAVAGVEIADEDSEEEINAAVERFISSTPAADLSDDMALDAYAQWRREAGNHRILSREEETELTTRCKFFERSAAALRREATRIEAEITKQREIVEMLDDPEYDAETRALLLAEPNAKIAQLESDLETTRDEARAAKNKAEELEDTFLRYNFRLVIKYAEKAYKLCGPRVQKMDLIGAGNEGMLVAFRKFDPSKGFKFSTFGTWHINQRIMEHAQEGSRIIKTPVYRQRQLRAIHTYRNEVFEATGAYPSDEELAEHFGKTVKKVREIMSAENVSSTGSLDKAVGTDADGTSLGDLIADRSVLTPEQIVVREALKTGFAEAFLRSLNARERRVLQLRYGLWDAEPHTLEWIGQRMKVTRERVRQIEAAALTKLRKDYLVREMGDQQPLPEAEPKAA